MISLVGRWLVPSIIVVSAGCGDSEFERSEPSFRHTFGDGATPWSHERFDNQTDKLTFAIVSDLYGGRRDGVFEVAMAQLALLRPEFIVSIGDLIDGTSVDLAGLNREWDVLDATAARAPAPFFHVGGNHDLTSQAMREVWSERYGARYYHFIYEDVLFLVFDTEDYSDERRSEIHEARTAALKVLDGDRPQDAPEMEYYQMPERLTGAIGQAQSGYFLEVIADHPDVRWTMLFTHKPVWQGEDEQHFSAIEAALSNRPYTVFSGHQHTYSHTVRQNRDYIVLGTTSGSQNPSSTMSFDHVTLVTITADGPTIAHLRLGGILDETGHVPLGGDTLCFQASECEGGSR